MTAWIYSLSSVLLVSVISLIGVLSLLFSRRRVHQISLFLVSFAVGGLLGGAFFHLIPEIFLKYGVRFPSLALIVSGILIFFVVEKFLRWRHCHIQNLDYHLHPMVMLNLLGDGVHNFIDGMVIAASYMIDFSLGVSTTLAILLHEIPQEIGDFGVLLQGGLSIRKALLFNFLSACVALLGAVFSLTIGSHIQGYEEILLPITAGGFLYIAGTDLIPELQHEVKFSSSLLQLILILLGLGAMSLLALFE